MSGPLKQLGERSAPTIFSKLKSLITPWTLTGPVASPEYIDALTFPDKWRKFSPGSQPVKAVVPHSKPELVYDIKYFTRERRRAEEKVLYGADTVKTTQIAVKDLKLEEGLPPVPGTRHGIQNWHLKGAGVSRKPLLEEVNNGYT